MGTEEFMLKHAELSDSRAEWARAIRGEEGPQRDFNAAVEREFRSRFPKRKFGLEKAFRDLGEWASALQVEYQERVNVLFADYFRRSDALTDELREMAKPIPVPSADSWVLLRTECSLSYHTQGFGAAKYARSAAEQLADKARFHGLEAEVREEKVRFENHSPYWDGWEYRYHVWAKTTPEGVVLLEFKNEVPLRERVRRMWARGVNPRVSMPFLPYGYEEEEGLDFFGNDLRPGNN